MYPALDQVYDFLVMEPSDDAPGVLIGHGHHFDTASTPLYAPQIGEMLSECLGWAYEGADRVWRWGNGDGVEEWAGGSEAFNNTLVTDEPDPYQLSSDTVAELTDALEALFLPPVPWNPLPAALVALVPALLVELGNPALFEDMFHGNIAWEYFRSEDPGEAVLNEVFCGDRWFKFRHLDEVFIDEQLDSTGENAFGSDPPYLLLGHSHEPRHRAWNPATDTQSDRYLNCGSAGRFQNLIWCTEIIDGVPQIAAWHRPGGPESEATAERRTYAPGLAGAAGTLTASDAHVPVPASRGGRGGAQDMAAACPAHDDELALTCRTRRLWACSAARRSPRSPGTIIRACSWLSGSTGPPRRRPPRPARPSSSSGTGRSAATSGSRRSCCCPPSPVITR